jgi:hypothetical protein
MDAHQMRLRRKAVGNETLQDIPAGSGPTRPPDLKQAMVHSFLRHILQTLDTEGAPWQQQLASALRGGDFDLRDFDGSPVLDQLTMVGDALAEALARGDAVEEVGQSILPHLTVPADKLGQRRKGGANDAVAKSHGTMLSRLEDDLSKTGRGIGGLASLAARGAGSLDPDATRRVLDRMRNVGDATMRLIEDRIASSDNREEGKRLRVLRDDFKSWIQERDGRINQVETAVDELNIRSNALRNECLMQAKRLAAAALLIARVSGRRATTSAQAGVEQATPEAMVLSAGLRALLLEAWMDITAPVRE